ncbi:cobalamin biosynthesis protein [Natribaculum luteum]|uniref:Cobalamin biosynthesis protein n=1 Tax=Natribaculum luteum TaxID=1586232 RepID=A0ABD5NWE6_9EURY|nr:cobalamin biosynthesis protein [Natribaculum luteum]
MSGEDALELEPPADLLAGHHATAYFWGHVAGSGEVTDEGLEVVTNDETSAETLAAIAGGDFADLERETTTREYAHDASITRTEEEYTVSIDGSELYGQSGPLGLPVDGRGNYRFSAFSSHWRELLRGLLEGCGTVCFKSSSGTVGISFVADDRGLLEVIDDLLESCPVDAPTGEIAETSSGGYWFGLEDAAVPDFGEWVYNESEETGLYAPSRRRKLRRSIEQAENV